MAGLIQVAQRKARSKPRRLPGDSGQRAEHSIAANISGLAVQGSPTQSALGGCFNCVWTAEGWLYVAVVPNLYSRRAVGWSMSSRMSTQLVIDALMMALCIRRSMD